MGNAYKILVGKSEGKISLGRSRRMWEDNIRKDLGGNRFRSCVLDSCGSE
jgi:hypothetical protein